MPLPRQPPVSGPYVANLPRSCDIVNLLGRKPRARDVHHAESYRDYSDKSGEKSEKSSGKISLHIYEFYHGFLSSSHQTASPKSDRPTLASRRMVSMGIPLAIVSMTFVSNQLQESGSV